MPFNTLYSKQQVSENEIGLLDSVIEIEFQN